MKMLLRRERPLSRRKMPSTTPKTHLLILDSALGAFLAVRRDGRTRHGDQLRLVQRMAEEDDAVPVLGVGAALLGQRENDAVHGRLEQPVRPVAEKVADVDQDGRELEAVLGVPVAGRGLHWHRRPAALWRADLQSRLAGSLEEKRHTAVVGVGTGTDVGVVLVGGCGWREDGRVVQVPQDTAG